jgi:hypothetical protein
VGNVAPLWENVGTAALSVLAFALLLLAVRAYVVTRSPRVLLLGIAFALFLAKGVLLTVGLFHTPNWSQGLLLPSLLLDVGALLLLYAAALRPVRP